MPVALDFSARPARLGLRTLPSRRRLVCSTDPLRSDADAQVRGLELGPNEEVVISL